MTIEVRNDFLEVNKNRIDKILYNCEIYRQRGGYEEDLKLVDIIFIIKALRSEIERLQREKNSLVEDLSSLTTKLKD